jgi:hypothetical protein
MTAPARRFANLVSQAKGMVPLLPLAHTADGFRCREIVFSKRLDVHFCDVFKESLLYLFYGRAAYRASATSTPTSLDAFSLVSFLLRTEAMPPPKRVFPFDTGAMHRGLFAAHLHPDMELTNFEVAPSFVGAAKIVETFYDDNLNYYSGRCVAGKTFPAFEMEAQSYYSLIQTKAQMEADDRRGGDRSTVFAKHRTDA